MKAAHTSRLKVRAIMASVLTFACLEREESIMTLDLDFSQRASSWSYLLQAFLIGRTGKTLTDRRHHSSFSAPLEVGRVDLVMQELRRTPKWWA